jgi:sirohydrochlorin cobaltochelatase
MNMNDNKALLAVSFGTSYPETRARTIDAIEAVLAAAFPDRRPYRAWTSGIIRRKLKASGIAVDSVEEALARMAGDGISDVLVQPTHLLIGEEYDRLCRSLAEGKGPFASVKVGFPLLAGEEDVAALAELLPSLCPAMGKNDLMVWMGHGSGTLRIPVYELLDGMLAANGRTDHAVGTVEYTPGFDAVLEKVRRRRPVRVFLAPLMVVAGDHAVNDMAGNGPDSWKTRLLAEGVEVECVLKGLGEYEAVRDLYVAHARKAKTI